MSRCCWVPREPMSYLLHLTLDPSLKSPAGKLLRGLPLLPLFLCSSQYLSLTPGQEASRRGRLLYPCRPTPTPDPSEALFLCARVCVCGMHAYNHVCGGGALVCAGSRALDYARKWEPVVPIRCLL